MGIAIMENVILVWPDGDWCWSFDLSQAGYDQFKSDDYEPLKVPEGATNDAIDYFVDFWIQSNRANEDLLDWWTHWLEP